MAKVVTLSKEDNLNRQLHGTAFLSLEHWAYMVLVVLVPFLLIGGFQTALALWSDGGVESVLARMFGMFGPLLSNLSMIFVAALLTLAPLMFVLQRRVEGELLKRPAYVQRTAYKLPIYGALAVLAVLKTVAFISLLSVLLQSFSWIGIKGADIGGLYLTQFLPSLLALLVFGATSFYVMKLAKGVNKSRQFAAATFGLSMLVAVMLFTTAVMANQNAYRTEGHSMPYSDRSMPSWYR